MAKHDDAVGLDLARARLAEWGEVFRNMPSPGARGYGRSCLDDSPAGGGECCAVPVSAEEVEAILATLPAIGLVDVRDALKIRYQDQYSYEQGAGHLSAKYGQRVSKTRFAELCERGEFFVLGRVV